VTPEVQAVLAAARVLVEGRRRSLELDADRPLPGTWEAALERALAAFDEEDRDARR